MYMSLVVKSVPFQVGLKGEGSTIESFLSFLTIASRWKKKHFLEETNLTPRDWHMLSILGM